MSVSYLNPKKSPKPKPTEHILPDFDSFVAVDLETTGLSDKDEIIEFGAVRITKGKFDGYFSSLVCPARPISPRTAEITGITQALVNDAPECYEVLPEFLNFVGNSILVGHNILRFDSKFLLRDSAKYGYFLKNSMFDTLSYARKVNSKIQLFTALNLTYLTEFFDINVQQHHRAYEDALAAAHLYFKLRAFEAKFCPGGLNE